MHILNDFFLLSWSDNSESIEELPKNFKKYISDSFNKNYDDFCDSCSILLMINHDNLDNIIKIKEFKLIFDRLFFTALVDKCLILQTQKELLKFIISLGDLNLNSLIKSKFEILRKEGIITYYVSRRLIGLFGLIKEKKIKKIDIEIQKAKKDKMFYKNSQNLLNTSIVNLKKCVEIYSFTKRLEQISKKLQNEKFSIGITGVMNAGKSTMLNALLGEEILGTAVVPETANLTVLKYSKNRYAKVIFWNKNEFEKIINSSQDLPGIKKFIDETKEHFKEELNKYITEEGRVEEVKVENLSMFTSVKDSNKKCNLVKSVELYIDLDFLKDGVEIVDTPGLDDPIIQREEITLQYVSDCDFMVHLMSVSQSATKKDIDFIIDSIVYQNIARLLIVITRIDTVSEKELEEVIEYTKASIKKRLVEQNRSFKLNSILEKIDFIPISGKMALLHKTNKAKEALNYGYDIQKTGINRIEDYLSTVLFGEDSAKANLIIQSNLNEIESILKDSEKLFVQESSLLNKSSIEIKKEFELYKKRKEKLITYLDNVKKAIQISEKELRSYFVTMEKFSLEKLNNLKSIIKKRVVDDVSYEMRKNKKLPQRNRIDYFVEIGIKDGLIDLVRDYRYEFAKKMQTSYTFIKNSFEDFESEKDFENQTFDSKEFFDKHFKSFMLFQNRDILLLKIYNVIKKYTNKNLEGLDISLDNILQNEVENIKKPLNEKLKKINEDLLRNFINMSKIRVEKMESNMNIEDSLIQKSMESIKNSSVDKKQRLEEIKSKKEILKRIKNDLSQINREMK